MSNLYGIMADLNKYVRIRASVDHLTDLLGDMNTLTPDMHAANGFSTLIDVVEQAMIEKRTNTVKLSSGEVESFSSTQRSVKSYFPAFLVKKDYLDEFERKINQST